MTAPSRTRSRQRELAREIAINEIRLEREYQTAIGHDYDDDINAGIGALLGVAQSYVSRAMDMNGTRRDMVKAAAMIIAALEVDTDMEVSG